MRKYIKRIFTCEKIPRLRGHCHGDFTVFLSKLFKVLTKNLFYDMKSVLKHRVENIKGFLLGRANYITFFIDFSTIHRKKLKKLANFFKF